MIRYFLFSTFIFLAVHFTYADSGRNWILLKSRTIQTDQNFVQQINATVASSEVFEGYYFRLIQFNEMPYTEQQKMIEETGLKLTGYIPNKTFYASIPVGYDLSKLSAFSPRTILSLTPDDKMNNQLRNGDMPDHARKVKGKVDIVVKYYRNLSADAVVKKLVALGYELPDEEDGGGMLVVRIDENSWGALAALPFVKHIEPIAPPSTPDDTKGRSLHRSNAINTDFSAGRHYDGSGVSVALADDGVVGPHIDFTGRITQFITSGTSSQNHGDMTSGIAVGAGNLDPTIRGMATGANIYIYSITGYPQIVDAGLHLQSYGGVITSTSYSQGCNDYNSYSESGDSMTRKLRVVLPVFSAGNNNGASCGYGAGTQWGNITGGYKQGKNVIACANLDANEVIDATSSRGPAADGRIKPDISSNGKDQMSTDENNKYQVGGGTSAACPGIAGICAQLYQAYRELTGQPNPEAALIKACLLNSAWDIGVKGPDYKFGFGRVNSLRAVKTLEENHYLGDSVSQGETNTHNIAVPAGVKQVKIMVLWQDIEGDANATLALVNDLNMQVSNPSSVTFNPWVLDPRPNSTTLNYPAVRGVDTLNNVEQVTIDNPLAGNYSITVNGFSVPTGPQKYYLVYEFWYDDVLLTYPFGGEGFVPGEAQLLRWDAIDTTSNFTLQYSVDTAKTWTLIAAVTGKVRQYNWIVPNQFSGSCFVRITKGATSDVNDFPFSMVGTPANIKVDWACPDSLRLSWFQGTSSAGFEISKLGSFYMDSIGTATASPFVVTGIKSTDTLWFSVRALTGGTKGRRAKAILKLPGVSNCVFSNIAEQGKNPFINIYPNPSNGVIHISLNEKETDVEVSIFNIVGEKIGVWQMGNERQEEINLNASPGIYFVQVKGGDRLYTSKVVVE